MVAVGHRDPRVGRSRHRRSDSRHTLVGNARPLQSAKASSLPRPKTNGSPPFSEPHVLPARASSTNLRLISTRSRRAPLPVSPAGSFRRGVRVSQQEGVDQTVVQHIIGRRQAFHAAQRDQARIAGPAPIKKHTSRRRIAAAGGGKPDREVRTARESPIKLSWWTKHKWIVSYFGTICRAWNRAPETAVYGRVGDSAPAAFAR